MGYQVLGCGFTSVKTVEGISVTTAGQPQVMVFAALTAILTILKKISSVTEARANYGYTKLDSMVVWNSFLNLHVRFLFTAENGILM